MRFLLDEAIQHRLADHLAEAGHDATPVVRIGLAGASDPEVLARAAAEDRILITRTPISRRCLHSPAMRSRA